MAQLQRFDCHKNFVIFSIVTLKAYTEIVYILKSESILYVKIIYVKYVVVVVVVYLEYILYFLCNLQCINAVYSCAHLIVLFYFYISFVLIFCSRTNIRVLSHFVVLYVVFNTPKIIVMVLPCYFVYRYFYYYFPLFFYCCINNVKKESRVDADFINL